MGLRLLREITNWYKVSFILGDIRQAGIPSQTKLIVIPLSEPFFVGVMVNKCARQANIVVGWMRTSAAPRRAKRLIRTSRGGYGGVDSSYILK